ncbi:MAG TPA: VOC family protein [Chloroflexota bacterium]|jgi:catechol 2,3-dioxygenase-like lactoylglutathione lyase family enzyme
MRPKFRHIAIVCKDPRAMAEWYSKAFDLEIIRQNPNNGVTYLGDGDFCLVLLHEGFNQESPEPWHFGMQMTLEDIEAARPRLEALGAEFHDGTRDGRSVEVYLRDPEGHRVDMAPWWPTKQGDTPRQHEYRTWEPAPEPQAAR